MDRFEEALIRGAEGLGVLLDTRQAQAFRIYKEILVEWNKKMNLTALTSDQDILVKHFLDSLTIAPLIHNITNGTDIADIGTGAGFPGIPIKLALPQTRVTLMDSLRKRVSFLEAVISELELGGARAVHERAENAGKTAAHREAYGVVVSRAVAGMPLLSEYCLPLVAKGGLFIAMKGPNVRDELAGAVDDIEKLGGQIVQIKTISLPYPEESDGENISRSLIVIEKIRHSPPVYPRSSAELSKIYKKNV